MADKITAANGDIGAAATWDGGTLPSAGDNRTIDHACTQAVSDPETYGATVINAGKSLNRSADANHLCTTFTNYGTYTMGLDTPGQGLKCASVTYKTGATVVANGTFNTSTGSRIYITSSLTSETGVTNSGALTILICDGDVTLSDTQGGKCRRIELLTGGKLSVAAALQITANLVGDTYCGFYCSGELSVTNSISIYSGSTGSIIFDSNSRITGTSLLTFTLGSLATWTNNIPVEWTYSGRMTFSTAFSNDDSVFPGGINAPNALFYYQSNTSHGKRMYLSAGLNKCKQRTFRNNAAVSGTLNWTRSGTVCTMALTTRGYLEAGDTVRVSTTSDADALPLATYSVLSFTQGVGLTVACPNAGAASGTCVLTAFPFRIINSGNQSWEVINDVINFAGSENIIYTPGTGYLMFYDGVAGGTDICDLAPGGNTTIQTEEIRFNTRRIKSITSDFATKKISGTIVNLISSSAGTQRIIDVSEWWGYYNFILSNDIKIRDISAGTSYDLMKSIHGAGNNDFAPVL